MRGINRKSTFKRMMILRPHLLYSEARSREVGVGHKENKCSEALGSAPVTLLIREPEEELFPFYRSGNGSSTRFSKWPEITKKVAEPESGPAPDGLPSLYTLLASAPCLPGVGARGIGAVYGAAANSFHHLGSFIPPVSELSSSRLS